MNDELDSLSSNELSDRFAIEVAGWSVMRAEAEHGDIWEIWHAEGRMVYPPKFAESLDEVVKYAGGWLFVYLP